MAGQLLTAGNEDVEFTADDKIPQMDLGDLEVTSDMELSLSVGDTSQIVATATNDISYASSDESVVSVDENGVITANGAGTAEITVASAKSETMYSWYEIITVTVTEASQGGDGAPTEGGDGAPAEGGEGAGIPSDGSEGSALPYASYSMDIIVNGETNPAEITANPGTVTLRADDAQGATIKWTYTPVGGPNAGVESDIDGATTNEYTFDLVTDPGPGETAGIYKAYANGEVYAVAYLAVGLVTYGTDLNGEVIDAGYDLVDNKITLKTKTLKIKKGKSAKIKASANGAKLKFNKVKGNKKIKVAKSGKVTAKAKKGTYKIKVKITAKATADFAKASKKFGIKVVVK